MEDSTPILNNSKQLEKREADQPGRFLKQPAFRIILTVFSIVVIFATLKPLEKSNELGFLYLLYSETNNKNNTNIYNVKVFDPATQKIEQIAKAVLPRDLVGSYPFLQYANGKLFYQQSIHSFEPSGEISSLDLRSGQRNRVVNISSSILSQSRLIESWCISRNSIFFLDCIHPAKRPDNTIAKGSTDCKLQQISLQQDKEIEATTLLDLSSVFKEESSQKSIDLYYPERNSLILRESYQPVAYTVGIVYYYELSLAGTGLKTLDEKEMLRILEELKTTDKGRCETLTEESDIFEKERVGGIYPPQIRIGCFSLEELKSITQKTKGGK